METKITVDRVELNVGQECVTQSFTQKEAYSQRQYYEVDEHHEHQNDSDAQQIGAKHQVRYHAEL